MAELHSDADSIAHLLEPSLSPQRHVPALYSVRASFMVAFFGGGLASVLFTGLNSRRLGRLSSDWLLLLAGGVFFLGLAIWAGTLTAPGASLPFEGDIAANSRVMRIVNRGLALVFFGLAFLCHRPFHRAATLSGIEPAKPWKTALACIALNIAVSLPLTLLGHWLG